jgi:hypothetical protein
MAIGLGIVLLLAGLVLALDVLTYDIPSVADDQLGILLIVVGIVAIVASLIWSALVSRRERTVEEHHYPPPGHRA